MACTGKENSDSDFVTDDGVKENTDDDTVNDNQESDTIVLGCYVGQKIQWEYCDKYPPYDTVTTVMPDTFLLVRDILASRIRIYSNTFKSFVLDYEGTPISYNTEPVIFNYPRSVDPVYGWPDGTSGNLYIYQIARRFESEFTHDLGFAIYGY